MTNRPNQVLSGRSILWYTIKQGRKEKVGSLDKVCTQTGCRHRLARYPTLPGKGHLHRALVYVLAQHIADAMAKSDVRRWRKDKWRNDVSWCNFCQMCWEVGREVFHSLVYEKFVKGLRRDSEETAKRWRILMEEKTESGKEWLTCSGTALWKKDCTLTRKVPVLSFALNKALHKVLSTIFWVVMLKFCKYFSSVWL